MHVLAKERSGAHLLVVGHLLMCKYPYPMLFKARPPVSGSLNFTDPGIRWEPLTVGFTSDDYCAIQGDGCGVMVPEAVT